MRRVLAISAVLALACAATAPGIRAQDAHLEKARALLAEVPLVDGHNDLPWQLREGYALDWDSLDISERQPEVMTDIPRLREGMVGAQFWSTYTPTEFAEGGAARAGLEQVDVVLRMIRRYPETFELASTAADVRRIHADGEIASMMGLEGGHMIENSLGTLRDFYRLGVRYMTLTHSDNTDWADSATDSAEHGGLTPFGEEVVREMNRLGMLVDLSHASDSTMWDALRVSQAPVIFSHSSSRHFTPHPRNVPDDVAQALAENGGLIMVTYVTSYIYRPTYDWYRQRDTVEARALAATHDDEAAAVDSVDAWEARNPRPMPGIEVVADHIDHLAEVAGVDHVGLGGDLDGISTTPVGLEDVSTYPALIAELLRRGWSDADVKKVIGLNALRVMEEAERVAERLQRERPPSTAQIEVLDGWETSPPWTEPSE